MLGHIVVSMFAEARRDPKVAKLLAGFSKKRKQRVIDAIEAAKLRETQPQDVDAMAMVEDLGAARFFRALVVTWNRSTQTSLRRDVSRWLEDHGYQWE